MFNGVVWWAGRNPAKDSVVGHKRLQLGAPEVAGGRLLIQEIIIVESLLPSTERPLPLN